jgi:hypothetical protein
MAICWPTFELLLAKFYSNFYLYLLDLNFLSKFLLRMLVWVAGVGQAYQIGGTERATADASHTILPTHLPDTHEDPLTDKLSL